MYPAGGPIRCVRCRQDIPGTDMFWTMDHVSVCGTCEGAMSAEEKGTLDAERSAHNELLVSVVEVVSGDRPLPQDAARAAQRIFVGAVCAKIEARHVG